MNDDIQTNTTGRLTPCLQQKIEKTRYTSTQSIEDKLKRVMLHDLEHGKQGKPRKSDENDKLDILVEIPNDSINGDFASSFAMTATRSLHKAPGVIAESVVNMVDLTGSYFAKVSSFLYCKQD